MPIGRLFWAAAVYAIFLTACASLAPGADRVRVTRDPSDIAACTALGDISLPGVTEGQINGANADVEFRNQTVGVGGNAALVTYAPYGVPVQGVAYRCP